MAADICTAAIRSDIPALSLPDELLDAPALEDFTDVYIAVGVDRDPVRRHELPWVVAALPTPPRKHGAIAVYD